MLLSIIVPVYNAEKYLYRCIDSIINQVFSDFELLLIDDGSTDNSRTICAEYEKKDSRVKVIHKENGGVSSARNVGLDAALGEYIGFVDADDYIEANMYKELYTKAKEFNADIVCCGYFREENNSTIKKCRRDAEYLVLTENTDIFREYMRQDYDNGFGDGNWNKLFKKEIIEDVRYKPYTNGEDVDFQIEILKKANSVVLISDLLYHYVCNADSATTKDFAKNYLSILKVADDCLTYIKENQLNNLKYAYAFHLTWYMSVLQKIYESKNIRECSLYINEIRDVVMKNYSCYKKNLYAKRLDKYLMKASKYNLVIPALKVRKLVRHIRGQRN